MKRPAFVIYLALILCAAMLAGCSAPPAPTAAPVTTPAATASPAPSGAASGLRVGVMKGPTGLGMIALMDAAAAGQAKNSYAFSVVGAADEISAKLISGELDVAAVPCNLAATLYNKTKGKVRVAAVNTLGVLYILQTSGEPVASLADLKGKTLYSTGKGTTPEFVLNYLLQKSGLTPGADVTVEYKTEAAELATLAADGKAELCLLPEPMVSSVLMKNPNAQVRLSLTEEWNKASPNAQLVTGVIVAQTALIEGNKAAFDEFLTEYAQSVKTVTADPAASGELAEKYGIAAKAVAVQAIPRCNIVYREGQDMKQDVQAYLSVLFASNPQSVGGALPDDAFYYQK